MHNQDIFFDLSELMTPYKIDCPTPFSVDATEGILNPYSSCVRTVSFMPTVSHLEWNK